jgi:heme/copper-type cytochrome/quinol oxidase subunit 3
VDLAQQDFTARTNAFGSIFFGLVALQMTLVLGGVHGMVMVALRAWKHHFSATHHVAVQCLGLYWYFTVAAWLVIAGTLYVFPRLA